MFKLLVGWKVGFFKNYGYVNNRRYRWLDNGILSHHYSVLCCGSVNRFSTRVDGIIYSILESRFLVKNKFKYLYIINEFMFDRRFIYSILNVRENKSRSRRTKRFINQHFTKQSYYVSALRYQSYYGISAKSKTAHLLCITEYFNTIWFMFWFADWVSARNKRFNVPGRGKGGFKKWYFNLKYISKKKPITYIEKKLKRNKKKPIVLKNHFNMGFDCGYVGLNYRYLLTRRGVV